MPMSTEKLKRIIAQMEPGEAASSLALVIKDLFSLLDRDARLRFIVDLTGDSGNVDVSSLVHL
jgi:hypothetical protein